MCSFSRRMKSKKWVVIINVQQIIRNVDLCNVVKLLHDSMISQTLVLINIFKKMLKLIYNNGINFESMKNSMDRYSHMFVEIFQLTT